MFAYTWPVYDVYVQICMPPTPYIHKNCIHKAHTHNVLSLHLCIRKPLCTQELLTQPVGRGSNVYISATAMDLTVKQRNRQTKGCDSHYTLFLLAFSKSCSFKTPSVLGAQISWFSVITVQDRKHLMFTYWKMCFSSTLPTQKLRILKA